MLQDFCFGIFRAKILFISWTTSCPRNEGIGHESYQDAKIWIISLHTLKDFNFSQQIPHFFSLESALHLKMEETQELWNSWRKVLCSSGRREIGLILAS